MFLMYCSIEEFYLRISTVYGCCVCSTGVLPTYKCCVRMSCVGVPHRGFNGVCGCSVCSMGVPRRGGVPLSSHTFSCMHLQLSSIQHLLTFSPQPPSRSSGINTIVKANYASSSADLRPSWELLWPACQVVRLLSDHHIYVPLLPSQLTSV